MKQSQQMELTGKQWIGNNLVQSVIRRFRHTIRPIKPRQILFTKPRSPRQAWPCAWLRNPSIPLGQGLQEDRAQLLDAIADQIMALGDELLKRAHKETGLPMARLTAERARAVNQANLFAELIREGSGRCSLIRPPDRQPLPKPDVRRMLSPIGPGCRFRRQQFLWPFPWLAPIPWQHLEPPAPLWLKGILGIRGCELLARAVQAAIEQCGLPSGHFLSAAGFWL